MESIIDRWKRVTAVKVYNGTGYFYSSYFCEKIWRIKVKEYKGYGCERTDKKAENFIFDDWGRSQGIYDWPGIEDTDSKLMGIR